MVQPGARRHGSGGIPGNGGNVESATYQSLQGLAGFEAHPLRHRNLWGLEEEGVGGAIRTSLVAPARKLARVEIEHERTEPERHRGRLDKTCSFPGSLPGFASRRTGSCYFVSIPLTKISVPVLVLVVASVVAAGCRIIIEADIAGITHSSGGVLLVRHRDRRNGERYGARRRCVMYRKHDRSEVPTRTATGSTASRGCTPAPAASGSFKEGYETSTRDVDISSSARLDIRIVAVISNVLSGVVFEVTASGRVPVEAVHLYCDSCGSFNGHTFTDTDALGRYTFVWSRDGIHALQVWKEGHALARPGWYCWRQRRVH